MGSERKSAKAWPATLEANSGLVSRSRNWVTVGAAETASRTFYCSGVKIDLSMSPAAPITLGSFDRYASWAAAVPKW